jgi:D-alanyl-lipoteichoic acid acyltransferase DltB (MBOAT superfamily)
MQLQLTTLLFLIAMVILFQLAPGILRKYVLIMGSMVFIIYEGGIPGIVVIALITLLTYASARLIFSGEGSLERTRGQKAGASVVITILLLILFSWKYIPWALSLRGINITAGPLSLPVPIGLSFYTFGAISYIADLYLGKLRPEKSIGNMALYMCWFPKLLSGPIERAEDFLSQLKYLGNIRAYSFQRITYSASYIVWGLVMKLLIADKVALAVDAAFGNVSSMGSVSLVLASLLYTIQIYCDFAAYSNMAIGTSKLFGIDLTQNFKTPYMAENIPDFWNRWHISLSSFLKDYIYFPLGGNRKGIARKCLNTAVVFFVCGLWHGTGLSFIIWGMLHALFSILAGILKKSPLSFLVHGIVGRIITFICVSFAWIFFRAENTTQALEFIRGMIPAMNENPMFSGLMTGSDVMLGLKAIDWVIVGVSFLILALMDYSAYIKDTTPPAMLIAGMSSNRRIIILSVVLSVVLVFGEYGSGAEIREFVYMNF